MILIRHLLLQTVIILVFCRVLAIPLGYIRQPRVIAEGKIDLAGKKEGEKNKACICLQSVLLGKMCAHC